MTMFVSEYMEGASSTPVMVGEMLSVIPVLASQLNGGGLLQKAGVQLV